MVFNNKIEPIAIKVFKSIFPTINYFNQSTAYAILCFNFFKNRNQPVPRKRGHETENESFTPFSPKQ